MQQSYSPKKAKKYFFKEVGWTISLPADFHRTDSVKNEAIDENKKEKADEKIEVKHDYTKRKVLIMAKKDSYNNFNATIREYDIEKAGSYNVYEEWFQHTIFKTSYGIQHSAKTDSAISTMSIDGVLFKKYSVTHTFIKENLQLTSVFLIKYYKGYDFSIHYGYNNIETKEQVESMLQHSKFKK